MGATGRAKTRSNNSNPSNTLANNKNMLFLIFFHVTFNFILNNPFYFATAFANSMATHSNQYHLLYPFLR